ncbi:MAG: flagellar protein FlbB [Pseudomonadota bacterium]
MDTSFKRTVQKMFVRVRLLTILILVAALSFMVRVGDAITNARSLSGEAYAEDVKKEEEKKVESKVDADAAKSVVTETGAAPSAEALKSQEDIKKTVDEKASGVKNTAEKPADVSSSKEAVATDVHLPSTDSSKGKKWEDAADTETEYPEIKKEMYQDLVKRRQEMDDKEKKMAQREALMDASQKEIDHKYKELVGWRDEIQGLLKKQTEAEDGRIDSLVKIYAGMKPKDAARIFNTLDMDVLLAVVSKMPEGRISPIIASMDADPARALTTMLAEQKKLPNVPQK